MGNQAFTKEGKSLEQIRNEVNGDTKVLLEIFDIFKKQYAGNFTGFTLIRNRGYDWAISASMPVEFAKANADGELTKAFLNFSGKYGDNIAGFMLESINNEWSLKPVMDGGIYH